MVQVGWGNGQGEGSAGCVCGTLATTDEVSWVSFVLRRQQAASSKQRAASKHEEFEQITVTLESLTGPTIPQKRIPTFEKTSPTGLGFQICHQAADVLPLPFIQTTNLGNHHDQVITSIGPLPIST